MHEGSMKNPLLDVIVLALLIPGLQAVSWLLAHEPQVRAIVTYSALIGIVWRGVVLVRRWQRRRKELPRPKRSRWGLKD